MRIAILDDYQDCIRELKAFELLKDHEVQIVSKYYDSPKALAKILNNPEALVLNRTRTHLSSELIELLPQLKVVSQTGKNAGHINVEACQKNEIDILEGRGNPISTAELTWSLIMNGLRLVPQSISDMKQGLWQKNIGRRVHGKRIGIWSYGRIGKLVAQYARAFGAEVIVWGGKYSCLQAQEDGFEVAKSKNQFFSECDVISMHLRLKESTKEIVGYEDLIKMKSDALFVNTARAGLIKPGALLKALKRGRPGFAALDVYDKEPIYNAEHPLLKMNNVICTPHLGYVELDNYELYFGVAFSKLLKWINLNSK